MGSYDCHQRNVIKMSREKNEYFRVGVITSTHALRGDVKVFPTTEDPARFRKLKEAYVLDGNSFVPVVVTKASFFKQFVILHFEGKDRIEDVERLVKKEIYVDRDHAIPLEEGEYYISDLIGLRVFDDDTGKELGELFDVLQTGANDVYVVKNGTQEILIPVIDECIRKVDLEAGEVRVHLLPGLV